MLKMEIHLKVSVPSDGLGVNQVIELCKQVQEQVGPALATCYLEKIQDQTLDQALGPKWANEPQDEAPWRCPRCGSDRGFTRRGSYPRVLRKSSLGRVPFDLRQVTCHSCDHTFSPFPVEFDLQPYQVSTTEFKAQAVEVACQTSYARAVDHIHKLARVRVSATAVHRWAQDGGARVVFDVTQANGKPVVLDSTKVLAGDKDRGCGLNLGLSIRRRYWTNGRPRFEVLPVCFGVNESWSETGRALEQAEPDRIVFDGDEAITGWVKRAFPHVHKQRGLWHLVRQLYWPLWRDGLRKPQVDPWMRRLAEIMCHPKHDVLDRQAKLKGVIDELSREGLADAATYLAAAAPHVFTYREHPDGMFFDDRRLEPLALSSTSPAERQMREINRRTDVGARWSVSGVRNLVSLDLVRRSDREQWRTLWRRPDHPVPDYSVVKLQVRAEAEPMPNVKTT